MENYLGRGARLGRPPEYRLYIDEVGNSDLASSSNPNHRYLSLTGLAFHRDHVRTTVAPRIAALVDLIPPEDPDDRVVLHRKDIMNRRGAFVGLRDEGLRMTFDDTLLAIFSELEFTMWTVVLDKNAYRETHGTRFTEPYLYCLTIVVERYVRWLQGHAALGDVMSESRGGNENKRLSGSYRQLLESGTRFIDSEVFQSHLTSLELKIRTKDFGILGLQLADLLASAAFRYARELQEGTQFLPSFDKQVMFAVQSKFDHAPDGTLLGWGIKWLP